MHTVNKQLSSCEKEVVELLLQGKSNKQIALALGISESTTEYHLKNVYKKLQVNSRTEAVLRLGKSIGNSTVYIPSFPNLEKKEVEPSFIGFLSTASWLFI